MISQKISVRQFTIFIILFSIGTTILVIPGIMAQEVQQDAWLAAGIGTGFGLAAAILYIAVGRLFPAKTLVEMNEILLGKWIGIPVSLVFILFSLYGAAELLYYVGTFLTVQVLTETPREAVHIIFACILVMGIRLGLETLARTAELLFPLFVFLFMFLVVTLILPPTQINHDQILPVFEAGVRPMIKAIFLFTSVFSWPLLVLLMIFPVSVNQPKKAEKSFLLGVFIAGISLTVLIGLTILVLGADNTARQMYPSYTLARKINVGNFLQRLEAVVAIMWFITIYFKMTIYFYAGTVGLTQILRIKDYRPLTMPLGLILTAASLRLHPNTVHSASFDLETWPFVAATVGLLLPFTLLLVYFIRRKKLRQKQS
ncbi:endospore germination permease [Cytobacillus firmus]|uniref:GerAB/ArcD/ProY family transporter n=1 Tax=Cytobacillus firmus TaxID=1399 RepID=UPI001C8E94D5|nr:endospore germination permease [Cytobacillus firmus]MBX9975150.1 endospore germination permease [Cytobacillus firmus]